jgi:hypothetical protein
MTKPRLHTTRGEKLSATWGSSDKETELKDQTFVAIAKLPCNCFLEAGLTSAAE